MYIRVLAIRKAGYVSDRAMAAAHKLSGMRSLFLRVLLHCSNDSYQVAFKIKLL